MALISNLLSDRLALYEQVLFGFVFGVWHKIHIWWMASGHAIGFLSTIIHFWHFQNSSKMKCFWKRNDSTLHYRRGVQLQSLIVRISLGMCHFVVPPDTISRQWKKKCCDNFSVIDYWIERVERDGEAQTESRREKSNSYRNELVHIVRMDNVRPKLFPIRL